MEMKNTLLSYIENCGISVEHLSKELNMDVAKFQVNSKLDWNAQELLQICSYLDIEPTKFYTRKIDKKGERDSW
ncbi:MAG: hypothetical protein IJF03_04030 [Lachnospiraceae bacterium]|nr:hypothetical protein [Lachnospiraceae bacterium]